MTRLYDAASKGDYQLVKKYLEEGDNPNEVNKDGETALHAVTLNPIFGGDESYNTDTDNRLEIARILLNAGADINHVDKLNRTALYYAAYSHDEYFVEFLLNNKADTEIADSLGDTPLNVASQLRVGGQYDRSVVIEQLLKAGANIESRNKIGFTPYFHIGSSSRTELLPLIDRYASEKAPGLSPNEVNLTKLLIKFSSLLSPDEENEDLSEEDENEVEQLKSSKKSF